MSWLQIALVYIAGYMVTMMFRGLAVEKPPENSFDCEAWRFGNVFLPLVWPIYGPGLIAWWVGRTIRGDE